MAVNTNFHKAYVIDASYLLAFLLPDEKNGERELFFDAVYTGEVELYAPELIIYEVGNALTMAINRKRILQSSAEDLIFGFLKLNIHFRPIEEIEVLNLSLAKKTTYYDGSYLWMCANLDIPLVSLDGKLKRLSEEK